MNSVKKYITTLAFCVFFLCLLSTYAYAQDKVTVVMDGTTLKSDVPPVLISGRVMVPIRAFAEALNLEVVYNSEKNLVLIDNPAYRVTGHSEETGLWVRGQELKPDVKPQLINGRWMLPLSHAAKALGVDVQWYENQRLVWVSTGDKAPPQKIHYVDRAVVLMYHHFDGKEQGATISATRFESHLSMLEQEGFNVVCIDELAAFLKGQGKLPPNAVVITMDDGYESNYTVAYPMLQRRGWPATVFMIVSDVGVVRPWSSKLTWEQMEEMAENGFAFYSHTYDSHYYVQDYLGRNLPVLVAREPGESVESYRDRVFGDIHLSRGLLIEHLGGEGEHFSLPYGAGNQDVLDLAQKAGYKYVWTIEPKAVTRDSNPMALGRANAGSPWIDAEGLKKIILEAAKK